MNENFYSLWPNSSHCASPFDKIAHGLAHAILGSSRRLLWSSWKNYISDGEKEGKKEMEGGKEEAIRERGKKEGRGQGGKEGRKEGEEEGRREEGGGRWVLLEESYFETKQTRENCGKNLRRVLSSIGLHLVDPPGHVRELFQQAGINVQVFYIYTCVTISRKQKKTI